MSINTNEKTGKPGGLMTHFFYRRYGFVMCILKTKITNTFIVLLKKKKKKKNTNA
jgi:hypothetical protein